MSEIAPVSIERDQASGIVITWSDDEVSRWTAAQLRKICPCATCREQRRNDSEPQPDQPLQALPVLSLEEAKPVQINSMRPVGSYAYNIGFSDGHTSGIFPFKLLRDAPSEEATST